MIPYRFEKLVFNNGVKNLVIIMEDNRYSLAARYLMSDIQSGGIEFELDLIDSVMKGEKESAQLAGNVCGILIERDNSVICNEIIESENCVIATSDLRNLLIIWHDAVKSFKSTGEVPQRQSQTE